MKRNNRARRLGKIANDGLTDMQKFNANQKALAFGDPEPFPEQGKYKNIRINDVYSLLTSNKQVIEPALTLDDIKERFSIPQTLGAPRDIRDDERERFNMTFDSAGGFEQLHATLSGHLADLGQFPVAGFVGYGVLQNLAQNPAISRAISVVADEVTKNWIEIKGGEQEDVQRVNKLTELVAGRYDLQRVFRNAVRMVGFYGGALIFIDTGASGDELRLPLPIEKGNLELAKGNRLSFRVIDPVNVSPCDYNSSDPLRADYMKPKTWWVAGQQVHASRLLVLYDDEPPTLLKPAYNFLGIPLAQKLADSVAHWNASRITVNNLLEKLSLLVMQTSVDEALSTAGGIQMLDMRMKALEHHRNNNSVFMCDKESEAVQNVQTSIAGAAEIVKMNREDFAAAVGVPGVKLFGLSPGGFNATGESDLKSFYDHVRSQQEIYRPQIQRCLNAIQLVTYGDIDKTIYFDFAQVSPDNGTAMTMNNSTKVNSIVAAVGAGLLSAEEGREFLRRDPDLGLDFIDEEPPEDLEQSDMGDENNPMGGASNEQSNQESPDLNSMLSQLGG